MMQRFMGPVLLLTWSAALFAGDLQRGVDLYEEGSFDKAINELRPVVEESPDNARAQRYLGLALLGQEKNSEAAPYLNKAHELEPTGETKLALAQLYVQQKDYGKAEEMLNDASGDDLEYVRGLLNYNRQKYQEAANNFESYLRQKPQKAYPHYYAGLAYNNLKRPDKMLSHFEMFLKMKPDAPEARKVRAVVKTGR